MSAPSDRNTATMAFFGGAIVVALILFGVSRWTTSRFESHSAAPAAAHQSP
jgi:hypothetical protein